ncbi:MAG: 3-deoxy-7-phosphoheptulonate synthase [Pyrinomonadaceae bacterium]|nr:3-deoxy-7-phosphoheptulonate synthase [Pyrinomonadaceae bacterium]
MIITMNATANGAEISRIIKHLKAKNYTPRTSVNGCIRVAALGKGEAIDWDMLRRTDGVAKIEPPEQPYILASWQMKPERSIVKVRHVEIGGAAAVVMAGPCSVESREQVLSTARAVKKSGAVILRGGAYKPRTSPYEFQGLGVDGLKLLREAGDATGLPVITEVLSEDDVEIVAEYADMFQIGARNMQNFSLLRKIGKMRTPVLLKRGAAATVKEWLCAAEYILAGGNESVVLCERGIKTFDNSLRNTLDLAAVALVKELSHLPVIVDPSHACGKRSLISVLSKAALAVGADGVIVEVHPTPEKALSDAAQQLDFNEFGAMMRDLRIAPNGTPVRL